MLQAMCSLCTTDSSHKLSINCPKTCVCIKCWAFLSKALQLWLSIQTPCTTFTIGHIHLFSIILQSVALVAVVVVVKTQFSLGLGLMLAKCFHTNGPLCSSHR